MIKFLLFRPIAVIITTIALIALGFVTFNQIPVSLLPDIAIPEITIQISYPYASARELQTSIVRNVKNQLQQVNHLSDINAETRDGLAVLKLTFDYGTNINLAYIETNEKIDGIIGSLPKDLERPKVIKAGAGDIPVFNLNIVPKTSNSSFLAISEFCENVLKRRIEQLPEVALVDISGLSQPEAVIIPDKHALLSLGISEEKLSNILKQNNIELGNLLVKDGQYQYNIRFASILKNKEDIENIYFKTENNEKVLQLKEIAQVHIREQKVKGIYSYNGKRAIVLSIIKQSDTQLLKLKKELNKLILNFEKDYPDLEFFITQDQTELLDVSINNLISNLITGGLFAFIVIFFFLNDFKAPILIGITIPVSLIVTFLFFYFLHISINVVSLAGLVLGIGMVVDSAIIVIENIEQFRAKGFGLEEACITGTNEVMLPLFTSILTNSAVFLPLVFMSGIAGSLFYDQAVSVSLALGISLFCSFTLVPVLYRLFYIKQERKTGFKVKKPTFLVNVSEKMYELIMKIVFKNKLAMIAFFTGLLGISLLLFSFIPKQGMPDISRTELETKIDWNEPLTIQENNKRINQILASVKKKYVYAGAFVGQQQFLLNRELQQNFNETTIQWKVSSQIVFDSLSEELKLLFKNRYPNAILSLQASKNVFEQLFKTTEPSLQIKLVRNNLNKVPEIEASEKFYKKCATINLSTEPPALQNRIYITILNEKLLLYDVNYESVYQKLKTIFNENGIGNLKSQQKYIPIVLGGKEERIVELIKETDVINNKGQTINIENLIKFHTGQDYKSFFSGKEGDFVPFNFQIPNNKIPETELKIKDVIKDFPLIGISFSGSYYKNAGFIKEIGVIILVAIGLLFFILSAQFESLLQPLMVMVAVVFGLTGSMIFLYFAGNSINIMSTIGMIVLIGIVDNDSILKIDTMNKNRDSLSLMDSIINAGRRRLKAQLMTSITAILGLAPVLFSSGLGAELQKPLALSVIGGIALGSFVSISFIPLIYWFVYSRMGKQR